MQRPPGRPSGQAFSRSRPATIPTRPTRYRSGSTGWKRNTTWSFSSATKKRHPWSEYCLRHADEVLFLADATAADRQLLDRAMPDQAGIGSMRHRTLVLVHPAQTAFPQGTSAWLASFPVDAHVHLREGSEADFNRLARTLFGTAIGLVFGGGGARGFAHLGVLKAMEEAGIPVDFVGGASIGAIMATFSAFDTSAAKAIEHARKAFANNPTGDLNIFPLISLIAGKRMRKAFDQGIRDLTGFDANLEDTWKPFFCIASNYSRATEVVLRRGPLAKSVRASVAIPAALPPVVMDGDLMIDGGTFNNFPTDVMATSGSASSSAATCRGARCASWRSTKSRPAGRSCSTVCGRNGAGVIASRHCHRSSSTSASCTVSPD